MSFLDFMSDAFGAGWSWLASQGSSKKSYAYQKKLMEDAYNLQQKGFQDNPLLVRKGLENAGYNPITGVGSTNAFSSVSGVPSSQSFDAGSNITNAFNARTQRRLATAQVDSTNAQASLFDEQAKTEQAKRTQMDFQNAMLDVEKHLKQKDLDTYDRRFYAQLYEQMQRAENYRAMANVQGYNAETQRIASNAQMLQAQTSEKWTPGKIGAGLAVGALGLFGPGKLKTLKNVTKVTKRSRNGRSSISQIFNEY